MPGNQKQIKYIWPTVSKFNQWWILLEGRHTCISRNADSYFAVFANPSIFFLFFANAKRNARVILFLLSIAIAFDSLTYWPINNSIREFMIRKHWKMIVEIKKNIFVIVVKIELSNVFNWPCLLQLRWNDLFKGTDKMFQIQFWISWNTLKIYFHKKYGCR